MFTLYILNTGHASSRGRNLPTSWPRLSETGWIVNNLSPIITVQKWQWFVFETFWYAFGGRYCIESESKHE